MSFSNTETVQHRNALVCASAYCKCSAAQRQHRAGVMQQPATICHVSALTACNQGMFCYLGVESQFWVLPSPAALAYYFKPSAHHCAPPFAPLPHPPHPSASVFSLLALIVKLHGVHTLKSVSSWVVQSVSPSGSLQQLMLLKCHDKANMAVTSTTTPFVSVIQQPVVCVFTCYAA